MKKGAKVKFLRIAVGACIYMLFSGGLWASPFAPGWHNIPGTGQTLEEFLAEHPEVTMVYQFINASWKVFDPAGRSRFASNTGVSQLDRERPIG